MQRECRNIYENARRTAGMTQERWAEALGISDSAVQQYEAGDITPSDEVVRRMIEVSMLPPLGYWHLCRKSELAADMLPSVERMPLAQAVVQLLARIRDFDRQHHDDALPRHCCCLCIRVAWEPRLDCAVWRTRRNRPGRPRCGGAG